MRGRRVAHAGYVFGYWCIEKGVMSVVSDCQNRMFVPPCGLIGFCVAQGALPESALTYM